MKTLNLRILKTMKTLPMPTEFYGTPPRMVKQEVESKLQWQTIENLNGIFIETDWHDVPTVIYDVDNDTYT